MLTVSLTAVVVTVLQLPPLSCAHTPSSVTRDLPLLDHLPQGPQDDQSGPGAADLTAHLVENSRLLAGNTRLLDTTSVSSHLFGTARRLVQKAFLPQRTPDLVSLLRPHNLRALNILLQQYLLPRNMIHQQGSSSRGIHGGTEDDEARLLLLYSLLPGSSDKRGRNGGWKTRGRRGRVGKGGWGDLEGKRQAVLDRMPLSYGRKREAWAAGSSAEGVLPDGEEAASADGGDSGFRGKRETGDSHFQPV